MNIGRKRLVLIEKVVRCKNYDMPLSNQGVLFPITDLFRRNMFHLEMEKNDGTVLDPRRICGFKIESEKNLKVLKIKTTLEINDWISDYEKVVIARIFLYDANGNDANSMDLDVLFKGYSIECDYHSDEAMKPIFSYDVIGE